MSNQFTGGVAERRCPETGEPAFCFSATCELDTCDGSKAQRKRFDEIFNGQAGEVRRKPRPRRKG